MYWIKKTHKWVSIVIGVQLTIWLISGLVFSLLNPQKVNGTLLSSKAEKMFIDHEKITLNHSDIVKLYPQEKIINIHLTHLLEKPVYRIAFINKTLLVDSSNGKELPITKNIAQTIAKSDYTPNNVLISNITKIHAPTLETRRHKGDAWQVSFEDEDNTSLYISSSDGRILERRNDTWRLFDFFWMLHILDYQNRKNFNNSIIIFAAFTALWLALSGCILLFSRVSFRNFSFGLLSKHKYVDIHVYNNSGKLLYSDKLQKGSNLLSELNAKGITLPSACNGAGSCGQCKIKIKNEHSVVGSNATSNVANNNDINLIPADYLSKGYRLACQQSVKQPIIIELDNEHI